jgi:hypothetical protein
MTNPTVTPNGGDIAEGVFGRKGCQAGKGPAIVALRGKRSKPAAADGRL